MKGLYILLSDYWRFHFSRQKQKKTFKNIFQEEKNRKKAQTQTKMLLASNPLSLPTPFSLLFFCLILFLCIVYRNQITHTLKYTRADTHTQPAAISSWKSSRLVGLSLTRRVFRGRSILVAAAAPFELRHNGVVE